MLLPPTVSLLLGRLGLFTLLVVLAPAFWRKCFPQDRPATRGRVINIWNGPARILAVQPQS